MIKTLIIENEEKHSAYLSNLLEKNFPEIEILGICDTVPGGIKQMYALMPELIFLDVELGTYTGFDLLEQTRSLNYEVIFTTSFNQYAAKAFRFCALDYIEKPFGIEDLKEAIDRYKKVASRGAKPNLEALLHNLRQTDSSSQKVGIPVLNGLDFVAVSEIIFCRSENNCTHFYLTEKRKFTATKTLKWIQELLQDHPFFRVHDSYLVNLKHIVKYRRGGEGGVVELSEKQEVDVSRRRKDGFLTKLSELGMT